MQSLPFPSFDEQLPFLNQFILELVAEYHAGKLNSWDELDEKVKTFFTPGCMEQMESLLPGWQKMASYSEGITVTHVMCVFLGVFMLSEFQALTPEQQQIEKWIVLFHDLDKFHIRGKKDTMHAFRSGALTAKELPVFGFSVTEKYTELIDAWYELTLNAYFDGDAAPKPDNGKLPEILSGIDQLFGDDSPAALITKTALLHISLDVDPQYPTPAPFTEKDIRSFISPTLFPLLKVMMLGDSDGWVLFDPEDREIKYKTAVAAFQEIERLLGI